MFDRLDKFDETLRHILIGFALAILIAAALGLPLVEEPMPHSYVRNQVQQHLGITAWLPDKQALWLVLFLFCIKLLQEASVLHYHLVKAKEQGLRIDGLAGSGMPSVLLFLSRIVTVVSLYILIAMSFVENEKTVSNYVIMWFAIMMAASYALPDLLLFRSLLTALIREDVDFPDENRTLATGRWLLSKIAFRWLLFDTITGITIILGVVLQPIRPPFGQILTFSFALVFLALVLGVVNRPVPDQRHALGFCGANYNGPFRSLIGCWIVDIWSACQPYLVPPNGGSRCRYDGQQTCSQRNWTCQSFPKGCARPDAARQRAIWIAALFLFAILLLYNIDWLPSLFKSDRSIFLLLSVCVGANLIDWVINHQYYFGRDSVIEIATRRESRPLEQPLDQSNDSSNGVVSLEVQPQVKAAPP